MTTAHLRSTVLVLSLAMAGGRAVAQPPDEEPADAPRAADAPAGDTLPTEAEAKARRLFEQGLELADEERWGEAVELFRRSRGIEERPSTVFNLGVALVRMARHKEAIRTLRHFVEISDPDAHAGARAEAERLIGVAESSRARLRLDVEPSHAEIWVDGEPTDSTGTERALWLDPGRHTLRVQASGYESQTVRMSALPGAQMRTEVTLARLTSDEPKPAQREGVVEPTPPARPAQRDTGGVVRSPWLWTAVAAVAVGAAIGIGVGVSRSGGGEGPYGGTSGVVLEPP